MAMRSVIVAMLGVAIAGGSAIGARHYLAATPAMSAGEPGTATELVQVIVASRDIPFGMEIQPQMLKVIAWPKEALPPAPSPMPRRCCPRRAHSRAAPRGPSPRARSCWPRRSRASARR